MLTTQSWQRDSIDLNWLSQVYVNFFRGEPWNEYVCCPVCKGADDFGPDHTWGEQHPDHCPDCGSDLVLFWGCERLEHYLFTNPQNRGFVVFCDGAVAGWQMGYPLDAERFYVDLIAILPEFRHEPGLEPFLAVFLDWIESMKKEGYKQIVARTHKRARQVRLLFRWLGFREGSPSGEDPDRTYWTYDC